MTESKSGKLLEAARRVLPGGRIGSYAPGGNPLVLAGGKGSRVFDVDGREYVDHHIGSGPLILGHAHPAVVSAVVDRVQSGYQFHHLTEAPIALAAKIQELRPDAERVQFATSGAEATFYALRLARAFTGRECILRFEGSYHGHHDYVMAPAGHAGTHTAGVPHALSDLVLSAPFNDLEATTAVVEANTDRLAAVIVEPLHRITPPHPGFLAGLRELTRRYGILLIFDEMITGFRLAPGGGAERYGVRPDLSALGKIIGGGFPIGAVAGRRDVMDLLDRSVAGERYVYWSGTLAGHPVSTVAGLATLNQLTTPGAYARLEYLSNYLREGLSELARNSRRRFHVVGDGSVVGIAFTQAEVADAQAIAAADTAPLHVIEAEMLRHGVYTCLGKTTKLYVSLAQDEDDLNQTLQAFGLALEEL